MVQELIPGGDDELYTVGSYIAVDGTVLGLFSGRKLRQSPPGVGTCRVGEAVWVQDNVDAALRLLRAFEFHGVSQVEFKRDPRDGRYKLMEINPRLWLWHGLAAALGVDFARIAYLDLLGRRGEPVTTEGKRGRWAITFLAGEAPAFQRPPYVEPALRAGRSQAGCDAAGPCGQGGPALIPPNVERRARWVLDTLGAGHLGIGDAPLLGDSLARRRRWAASAGRRPRRGVLPSRQDRGEEWPARRARPVPRVGDVSRSTRSAARAAAAEPGARPAALGRRPVRRRAQSRRGHSLALDAQGNPPRRRPAEGGCTGTGRKRRRARGPWARGRARASRAWNRPQLQLRAHRRHRADARSLVRLLPARGPPSRAGRPGAGRLRPAAATRRRDVARAGRRDRPSRELRSRFRSRLRSRGEGRARAPRRDSSRPALPLPPRRPAREPRPARGARLRLRLEPRLRRRAAASAPASRIPSGRGISRTTARSTSSRSRWRRWT